MKEFDIFSTAVELQAPADREKYLDQACGGNIALRNRIKSLLHSASEAADFIETPAHGLRIAETIDRPIAECSGTIIGPYKLLAQIGQGGMGAVFSAEQTAPVHRTVALKIIKPGMDSHQVISRFAVERDALALMDHPHIARVLDAGTTDSGRPYFVMDLVEGLPITEYCDAKQLSVRTRLELFDAVCQAVQHAHQKGVIHRDLKPSNVLVGEYDGWPVPKVIDFGVAKAIGGQLSERATFTGFGQIIGTFAYMSPEQSRFGEQDVDTRSDIYSLGVLLYELLTGSTPFEKQRLETAAFDETLRIIREEEPPRPSTRVDNNAALQSLATTRRSEPVRLSRLLSGELDWIVMKALEKDRNRRYATASALAADVRHYLNDEPVTAGAPSRLYRASKFVRRNKGAVIASAAVLVGLVAGIVGTTIGLVSQSRQRIIAERERAEAQLNFATALQSQRKYAEAEDLFRRELEKPSGDTTADRQRAAVTRLRLAEVVSDRSGPIEAEQLHRDALAAYREAFPPGDTNIAYALNTLAFLLRPQHRFAETEPLFREAYEIQRRAIPADHRAIGECATNLANVLITLGRYAEAEPIAREAVAEHRLAAPQDAQALAFAYLELGRDLLALDRFSEAEAALIDAQRMLGPTEHFHVGALSLVALYRSWDQAAPGKGHDAQAQKWLRHLIGTFVQPKPPPAHNTQR